MSFSFPSTPVTSHLGPFTPQEETYNMGWDDESRRAADAGPFEMTENGLLGTPCDPYAGGAPPPNHGDPGPSTGAPSYDAGAYGQPTTPHYVPFGQYGETDSPPYAAPDASGPVVATGSPSYAIALGDGPLAAQPAIPVPPAQEKRGRGRPPGSGTRDKSRDKPEAMPRVINGLSGGPVKTIAASIILDLTGKGGGREEEAEASRKIRKEGQGKGKDRKADAELEELRAEKAISDHKIRRLEADKKSLAEEARSAREEAQKWYSRNLATEEKNRELKRALEQAGVGAAAMNMAQQPLAQLQVELDQATREKAAQAQEIAQLQHFVAGVKQMMQGLPAPRK